MDGIFRVRDRNVDPKILSVRKLEVVREMSSSEIWIEKRKTRILMTDEICHYLSKLIMARWRLLVVPAFFRGNNGVLQFHPVLSKFRVLFKSSVNIIQCGFWRNSKMILSYAIQWGIILQIKVFILLIPWKWIFVDFLFVFKIFTVDWLLSRFLMVTTLVKIFSKKRLLFTTIKIRYRSIRTNSPG